MSDYNDIMSDMLGEDWEQWICPFAGTIGNDLCYVDRDSDECRKCEEENIESMKKQEAEHEKFMNELENRI